MKNPQVCNLMTTSYGNCSEIRWDNSLIKFGKINDVSWNSQTNDLFDTSLSYRHRSNNEINDIFNLIDYSKLILCSIRRQNSNIDRLSKTSDYRSRINYEKIKLVDCLKHLIINRLIIAEKLTCLEEPASYFLVEIIFHIRNLDGASQSCTDSPINEAELGEQFQLATCSVDCILNDCGFDLSEIDETVTKKIDELDKKLDGLKNRSASKLSKSRIERHCDKLLENLQGEITGNLCIIGKILDRLSEGHSSFLSDKVMIESSFISNNSKEINESQLCALVNLRYLLMELEKRVSEIVLELLQLKLTLQNDDNITLDNRLTCLGTISLSPISNRSSRGQPLAARIYSSTPSNTVRQRFIGPITRQYSILSESSQSLERNINEESLSSFDSGYRLTPANEPPLSDSGDDDFDIIPFSDDEYEKINDCPKSGSDIEENDSDLCVSFRTNSDLELNTESRLSLVEASQPNLHDYPLEPGDVLSVNYKEFCNQNNFCLINQSNEFLFSIKTASNINKRDVPQIFCEHNLFRKQIEFKNSIDWDSNFFSDCNLSQHDKEEISRKINSLTAEDECKTKFNSAWQQSLVSAQHNPSLILECLEDVMRSHQSIMIGKSINSECGSRVNIQDNNSAYSSCKFQDTDLFEKKEQNTNNNADSKDEDSNELSVTSDSSNNTHENLHLDTELRKAFKNILSNKSSTEHGIDSSDLSSNPPCNDSKVNHYRDVTVNINDTTISDDGSNIDLQDSISIYSELFSKNSTKHEELCFVEDLELMIQLSELHLRSEFQCERYNKSMLICDQQRIVENYKNMTTYLLNDNDSDYDIGPTDNVDLKRTSKLKPKCHVFIQTNTSINKDGQTDDTNHLCDTFDDINEMKSEFINNAELSINASQGLNTSESCSNFSKVKIHNNQKSLTHFERISVSVKLTQKLLNISSYQLNFISSMYNLKNPSIRSSVAQNKSFSILFLRQRLKMTAKIIFNLKLTIKNTHNSDKYRQILSEIDKLIEQSENLIKFSVELENWLKKNGSELEKIVSNNSDHELPDDLLIKMDSNDFNSVLATSTKRLQITVSALSQYPCYNYFLKSSFPKADSIMKNSLSFNHNFGNCLNNSDLLQKLCKLRRVTAVCALNIVDLHVLLTKLENDESSDHASLEDEVKNLLIFWRAVDGECHRLLRCTSLLHHVMIDTRKSYLELISLIAVMDSIVRTVNLTSNELKIMRINIDTLRNFKQKILDWLEEVKLCVSVIYKKRMTNKRFKFYDDIHNYLEENLNTISELSDKIRRRCHETVNIVNDIAMYCANLSNCSITDIGDFLTFDKHINNECFLQSGSVDEKINENLFNAIIDLEELTTHISNSIRNEKSDVSSEQFKKLMRQSNDVFRTISEENSKTDKSKRIKKKFSAKSFFGNNKQVFQEELIIENTTKKIIEKIYKIVTCAAKNALMLFIDKYRDESSVDNNDTEHQISNWTSYSDKESVLTEISTGLISEMSSIMTTSIIESFFECRKDPSKKASAIILRDLCIELGEHATRFLVEQISISQGSLDDSFLSETSSDIANYLCEELGCLMVNSSLDELQVVDVQSNNNIICISTCSSKLQQKLSSNLIEKSKVIISDFVQSQMDPTCSLNLFSCDFQNENCDCEFSKEISILPPNCVNNVPISSLRQAYDSHEVFKSFTRLFDSKLFISNHYACEVMCDSKLEKCSSKENHIQKPPLIKCNFSNYSQNRISKLVAQFNRNSCATQQSPSLVRIKLERMCLTMLNMRINQLVEEVVQEVIQEFKTSIADFQFISVIEDDKIFYAPNDLEKDLVLEIIPKHCLESSSIQSLGSEISSISSLNPEKRCFISTVNSCDNLQNSSRMSNQVTVRKISSKTNQSKLDYRIDKFDSNFNNLIPKNPKSHSNNVCCCEQTVKSFRPLKKTSCHRILSKSVDFKNSSDNALRNHRSDWSIASCDTLLYDKIDSINRLSRSDLFRKENEISDKRRLNISEIESRENDAINKSIVPFEVNSERLQYCVLHNEAKKLSLVQINTKLKLSNISVRQRQGNVFEEIDNNKSTRVRPIIDGLSRFENNGNNVGDQSELFHLNTQTEMNRKCKSSRNNRFLSNLSVFVIVLLVVLIAVFFYDCLEGVSIGLRLSQSLYPRISSNRIPH